MYKKASLLSSSLVVLVCLGVSVLLFPAQGHAIEWDFETGTELGVPPDGWEDDSAPGSTHSYQATSFDGVGALDIQAAGNTWDRVKVRTQDGTYTDGLYEWRVFINTPELGVGGAIPNTYEIGASSSVGGFLYSPQSTGDDNAREIDFEIGYGTTAERTAHGIPDGELMCYMTVQRDDSSGTAKSSAVSAQGIEPGNWYTLSLYLWTDDQGRYVVEWYLQKDGDSELAGRTSYTCQYGPSNAYPTSFHIECSVENFENLWIGEFRPTTNQKTWFDWVSYTENSPIVRGLQMLRRIQWENGSWSNNLGWTELCTLCFLNAGYSEFEVPVAEALQYLLASRNEDGSWGGNERQNYCTSIMILVLVATHNPAYLDLISDARDYLLSIQSTEDGMGTSPESRFYGGWGYPRGNNWSDISNTQWTLMALDAAYSVLGEDKSGADWIPKAIQFLEQCQQYDAVNDDLYTGVSDGGFIYHPTHLPWGHTGSYGGATHAGIWSYRLCELEPSDHRVVAALDWVRNNYSVTHNPGGGDSGNAALYYYYVSMAKAMTMVGMTQIVDHLGQPHDWFAELSEELAGRQYTDGHWSNWASGQGEEGCWEVATSWAVLALETRTLPPGADLYLSIVLASHCDLHVYDPQGRHLGWNYGTDQLDSEIPGGTFEVLPDGRQQVVLPQLEAGSYRTELVGTSDGPYELTIEGYQDDQLVSSETSTGTITTDEVQAGSIVVTGMEGALTLFVTDPGAMPILGLQVPDRTAVATVPETTAEWVVTVKETGGAEVLHGATLSMSDMEDGAGHVIPSELFAFDANAFDVDPGDAVDVEISVVLPVDFVAGNYAGRLLVESIDGGTRSHPMVLLTGEPSTAETATGTGLAEAEASECALMAFAAVDESALPSEGKPSTTLFPHGFFEATVGGLLSNESVTIALTVPAGLPEAARYWAFGPTASAPEGQWYELDVDIDDDTISVVLTDGGDGDGDLIANGTIICPVAGPGIPLDINGDGPVDALDVQLVINAALGLPVSIDGDVNGDGTVNALDVQLVINAALGIIL